MLVYSHPSIIIIPMHYKSQDNYISSLRFVLLLIYLPIFLFFFVKIASHPWLSDQVKSEIESGKIFYKKMVQVRIQTSTNNATNINTIPNWHQSQYICFHKFTTTPKISEFHSKISSLSIYTNALCYKQNCLAIMNNKHWWRDLKKKNMQRKRGESIFRKKNENNRFSYPQILHKEKMTIFFYIIHLNPLPKFRFLPYFIKPFPICNLFVALCCFF